MILGYRVAYSDEGGSSWNLVVEGENNTHVELKSLQIYTLYCVRIMGYNRRGDGKASFPVCTYTDKDGKSRDIGTSRGIQSKNKIHRVQQTDEMIKSIFTHHTPPFKVKRCV